jgi:uncharacterized membrane protein YedE/YeeE
VVRGRQITATWLAVGLLAIIGLVAIPPIWTGMLDHYTLNKDYIDFVKWTVTVLVAALGPALGFFFSEQGSSPRNR